MEFGERVPDTMDPSPTGNRRMVARCCDLSIDSPGTGRPPQAFSRQIFENNYKSQRWWMLIFVCFSLVSSRHTPIVTNAPPRWMWRCRCRLKPPRWTSPPTVYNIPNVLQPSIPQTIHDYCTINSGAMIDCRPDLFPVNTNVTRPGDEETRLCATLSVRAGFPNQRTRNVSGIMSA